MSTIEARSDIRPAQPDTEHPVDVHLRRFHAKNEKHGIISALEHLWNSVSSDTRMTFEGGFRLTHGQVIAALERLNPDTLTGREVRLFGGMIHEERAKRSATQQAPRRGPKKLFELRG